ncbi:MAG: transcription-repair coupling factor [Eubacteriales bacterium]|nr:transcription-repair coupling factor [Eubacteriales bacterium]
MKLNGFSEILAPLGEYQELIKCINKGILPVNITGVSESSAAHLIFCLRKSSEKPALIVVPDGISAQKLLFDLQLFYGENVAVYPERELIFYDIEAQAKDIITQRMTVLEGLSQTSGGAPLVIATISAVMGPSLPKDAFEKRIIFKQGSIYNMQTLAEKFISLGYVRENIVEGKGQFSIRGGIIDFYPHGEELPVRVELFGDEIDSIRNFDPLTQRSLDALEEATAAPAGEILISPKVLEKLIPKLKKFTDTKDETLKANLNKDIEKLENGTYFHSIDKYLPLIYDETPTLLDYFDENSFVFLYEPAKIKESGENIDWQLGEQVADFMEKSIIPRCDGQWHLGYGSAVFKMTKMKLIGFSRLSQANIDYRPKHILRFAVKQQGLYHGKIELFFEAMHHYRSNEYTTIIFGGSETKAKNLAGTLRDEKIEAVYLEALESPPKEGQVIILPGEITQGFEYPTLKLAIVGDREIFGRSRRQVRRRTKKSHEKITSLTDLNIGDFVVHQNHGIGQFAGIKTMTVDGATSDYVHIKFRGNDSLYVPVNQLDLIFKYTGKDSGQVRLSKLGGTEWQKTKQKVKQSAADMADQLIRLYAIRQNSPGIAFSPDGDWHRQFAATFPYEETEDQLRCIEEVRKDMENSRPMDRLLCGDAGYGKTEVALRAAFKAVMDGYQVAYLVPTTILANQHYMTFCERMKDFPIKVEMLSRFRTVKEQKETVKRCKTGEVDIVIGTHRILQKDLKFHKLGLLIIDEEQRFGVAHKEHLKELKSSVDVLTLTATPIPRTLHMSLAGIRDVSILENPPKDRYPVNTYVLEYSPEVFKDAILREIARGGQVYYLYNRVQSINRVAAQIRAFSEDLRVAVAHGKMSERELEDIMQQVFDKEIDVLVCTTIIETGLDIPNVNTIIVEDADRLGLSQLYQLRGRVGRSNRIAYAYLSYKRDKVLSEVAEKRLSAIRDFTEFGSGFKIALRDLEIRGAGNIIGAQQHGHMEAVGYDMYCKLLAEAVSLLKGEPLAPEVQTVVSINVNAFIPKDYIVGENYRIEIYKKIASVENQEDWLDVYDEIQDRYGDVPKTVTNLIDISLIRNVASSLGIDEIKQKEKNVVLSFSKDITLDLENITGLLKKYDRKLLFSPSTKPYLTLKTKGTDIIPNIKTLLQDFKQLKSEGK